MSGVLPSQYICSNNHLNKPKGPKGPKKQKCCRISFLLKWYRFCHQLSSQVDQNQNFYPFCVCTFPSSNLMVESANKRVGIHNFPSRFSYSLPLGKSQNALHPRKAGLEESALAKLPTVVSPFCHAVTGAKVTLSCITLLLNTYHCLV